MLIYLFHFIVLRLRFKVTKHDAVHYKLTIIGTMVYAHGTHFVFPEEMLKIMLPVGSGLFVKWAFHAARKYPKECRETRKDIEKRMSRVLAEWKGEK